MDYYQPPIKMIIRHPDQETLKTFTTNPDFRAWIGQFLDSDGSVEFHFSKESVIRIEPNNDPVETQLN